MDRVNPSLFFLRHPSTLSNANDIFMGQEEVEILPNSMIDLTPLSAGQNEMHVYYSSLKRGQQTVLLLLQELVTTQHCSTITIESAEELKERMLGEFQKQDKKKVRSEFAQYFKDNIFIPSMTPPNGETFSRFQERVSNFNSKLRDLTQTTILVSHLQVYRMLICLRNNYDPDTMWSKINCSHGQLVKID